ncbi:MAG: pseudaminic acid biosynthesis-associated methylase [Burkholderiales bacterium]
MTAFKTEQENFWAGAFGDEYTERNVGLDRVASNCALFSKILARTGPVASIVELGANVGLNLRALRRLLPAAKLSAVEINDQAVAELHRIGDVNVVHGSLLDETVVPADMALIKGVLIHIAPDNLSRAYERLNAAATRWLVVAEYYNPTPIEVSYRGHSNRLFKRDFAGEMLDRYSDLHLVDCGFAYHRGPFPQDDLTWFLLERR